MISLPGKVLGNRYILLDKIGCGGMALVYKARCQLLNRYVAVKILRPEFTSDEEFVKKFKRESLAAASLSHPNIVGIYDVGQQDDIYYIVMEYVNGQTLKDYIKNKGPLDYNEVLNISSQIAKGLDNAHRNGVVHRDIKPHNILITDEKIVKVTDFGIARASASFTVTNMGNVMGSAHYFSPEQAKGLFTDHRTDIYSLGAVMYEMLTGRPPFDADSPISVAIKHIQDTIIEPKELNSEIPNAVNNIVVKALQKDMTKRYQSIIEMFEDIERAIKNPNDETLVNESEVDDVTRVIPVKDISKAINKSKTKNKLKWIPLVLGLLIVFSMFVLIGYWYKKSFEIREVKVPPIVGLNEAQAKEVLSNVKLKLEVLGSKNSDKPEGQIISVDPLVGTTVKENVTIKVILSSGQRKVKVPDVTKLDRENAEELLRRYGLVLGKVDRKNSDEIAIDLIMEQSPVKGIEVTEGSSVDIVISNGKEVKLVPVPDLKGKTLVEATQMLTNVNLVLGNVNTRVNVTDKDNEVMDQNVAPNIKVPEGTAIDITINKIESSEGNQ